MEKLYYCTWSQTDKRAMNSYDPEEREEKEHFFTEDNGYTKEDIFAINQLDKGEVFNCEYGNHIVRRIK